MSQRVYDINKIAENVNSLSSVDPTLGSAHGDLKA